MSDAFTPGVALRVGYNCVVDVTKSNRPIEPSEELRRYNVRTDQHVLLIDNNIHTNRRIGLPAHRRTMPINALKDMDSSWTMRQLGDVIFQNSVPAELSRDSSGFSRALESAFGESVAQASSGMLTSARNHPVEMMAVAAAAGMVLGFLIGRSSR
jgi:hypothetical protein